MGGHPRNKTQYHALMNRDCHKLEKSLSVDEFKPFSGKDTISKILTNIKLFSPRYGFDVPVKNAIHTLREYVEFHKKIGRYNLHIENLDKKVSALEKGHNLSDWRTGGVIEKSKEQLASVTRWIDPERFFLSRYSIRNFSPETIDPDLIKRAVWLSTKTPSVCNRQGWKAYYVIDEKLIKSILAVHGGIRGFDHTISKILVIAGDINHFSGSNERNQVFIDGGMFSMSVVYSLHALGIGSCCLNWSVDFTKDIKLRKILKLNKSESVIMIVAVGHYPDKVKICQSHRKSIDEVFEIIK
ncbi:MAG TPA: nitroreductase family protein [Candidatus Paceibacterota bacterium]|nr:nitroreductase family protein [Candidatus Paceibacterota bacterium]